MEDVGQAVVAVSFTAAAKHQWRFIRTAISQATSDAQLGHIAAGPIEHLLGWHGADYIDQVEAASAEDEKLARALTGVLQYKLGDEVWPRVRAVQALVANPLKQGD